MSVKHLFHQTCDLYAPTVAANGLAGYSGTASTSDEPCRIEEAHKEIQRINQDSRETAIVLIDSVCLIGPGVTVTENYKLVSNSISYIVEKVNPIRSRTALIHYELLLRGI